MTRVHGHKGQLILPAALLVLVASGAAALLVFLDDGPLLVALAAVLIILSLTYLVQPFSVLKLFVFIIPLLIGQEVIAGINAGEFATLYTAGVGIITLLVSREKLADAFRSLGSLLWPLLGLTLVGIVSAMANAIFSLPEILQAILKPLAFAITMLLVYAHTDSHEKANSLLRVILVGGFAVAIYSIFAYGMGWSYYPQYGYSRATGTFEHWNQLGGYMVLLSIPTLFYALSAKHRGIKIGFLLAFITEIVALLLSLTIGSMISLLVSGVIALFVLFKSIAKRTVGLAFLLILAFLSVELTTSLIEARIDQAGDRVTDRLSTYAAGFQLVRDHFWFGLGSYEHVLDTILYDPAGYRFTPFGETSSIPHNSFLNIFAEKGIFGLLLLVLLVVNSLRFLFRRSVQESRYHRLKQGFAVGVLGFLIQNMTNSLLLHVRIGLIFFALIAVMARINRLENAES